MNNGTAITWLMSNPIIDRRGRFEIISSNSSNFLTKSAGAAYKTWTQSNGDCNRTLSEEYKPLKKLSNRIVFSSHTKTSILSDKLMKPRSDKIKKRPDHIKPQKSSNLSWWEETVSWTVPIHEPLREKPQVSTWWELMFSLVELGTDDVSMENVAEVQYQVWNPLGVENIVEKKRRLAKQMKTEFSNPDTILGACKDNTFLARLRSVNGEDLSVVADEEVEIVLKKKINGQKSTNLSMKIKVVEIYFGFQEYLHSITDGMREQRSTAGKNAFIIFKPTKILTLDT